MNSYKRRRLLKPGDAVGSVVPSKLGTIDETPELVDLDVISEGKLPPTPTGGDHRPSPLSKDYYDALDDEDDEEDANDVEEVEEDSEEDSICTYGDYFEDFTPTLEPKKFPLSWRQPLCRTSGD